MKFVSAKCPNCGADLKLSEKTKKINCDYCKKTIMIDEINTLNTISVDGITTNVELIESANELLKMNEFLKAKKRFLEFTEKCPNDYQGWLGLLICRTRNFTIRDKNILFEKDINNYYNHFLEVAPDDIKEKYSIVMETYNNDVPNTEKKSKKNSVNYIVNIILFVYIILMIIGFLGICFGVK